MRRRIHGRRPSPFVWKTSFPSVLANVLLVLVKGLPVLGHAVRPRDGSPRRILLQY